MTGYHYARKITVTDEERELIPAGFRIVKGRPRYCIRSDGGSLTTRHEDATTLTEARRIARNRARDCGWAEIFQWAETGTQLRRFLVSVYDREMKA
jgi:hypothetical protein